MLDPRFQVVLKNFKGIDETVAATPRSSDGQLLFLMDMVSKMKPLQDSPSGTRIASVHNGSSLFTGDAGSGESNIRRYIIENDYLEAIAQLPNNMFYNTGITTYIWILSNNKALHRRGKVQLIDASSQYLKLRKNLGAKNCEFSAEHIDKITHLYLEMPNEGISKVFDNSDFGYYKVTIERPLRLAAQFTPERLAGLRFVSILREVMEWMYEQWGEAIYSELAEHQASVEAYLEQEGIELSKKQRDMLLAVKTWESGRSLLAVGEKLMSEVGQGLWLDFNEFSLKVEAAIKKLAIKLSASEKTQLMSAVSWRDEKAEKVVKKVHKLKDEALSDLLLELDTSEERLQDFGYWTGKKPGQWIEYESDSELRDTENVPLKDNIYDYFVREVRPQYFSVKN